MFFLEIMVVLLAYLIGSLSAALIVSKKLGMPDPRSYGSGNPGASNMLRSGRKDAAAMTLIGDALKGLIAILIARCFASWLDLGAGVVAWSAIAVVVGHMWPVFFGFKGGKGVATALGVLLGMSFWATFWVVVIWAIVALKFKKSSLAALVAAACSPFVTFIVLRDHHVPSWGWAIFFIAILVIYRHRANIKRLCSGDESSIGQTANNYAQASTYAASSATVAETPQTSAPANQADEAVSETVAEVVEPAISSEKVDVAPLPENEMANESEEAEIDASQADLRDGDALEEEVIQAAVNNAQAAQEAVAAQSEEANIAADVAQAQAEENSEAPTETAPKKRGRKKADPS